MNVMEAAAWMTKPGLMAGARVEDWVWGSQVTRMCKKHPIVHDASLSPGGGAILEGLQKVS